MDDIRCTDDVGCTVNVSGSDNTCCKGDVGCRLVVGCTADVCNVDDDCTTDKASTDNGGSSSSVGCTVDICPTLDDVSCSINDGCMTEGNSVAVVDFTADTGSKIDATWTGDRGWFSILSVTCNGSTPEAVDCLECSVGSDSHT